MAQRAKKIAEENSHHDCDFRDMLSRVGDKWSLLVIFILKGRPAFRGAVLGFEAQHSGDIAADAHGHRAEPRA